VVSSSAKRKAPSKTGKNPKERSPALWPKESGMDTDHYYTEQKREAVKSKIKQQVREDEGNKYPGRSANDVIR